MDFPYHFRALDKDGNTIRQSTAAFPTLESAQEAADRATRTTGDVHVVCESIAANDARNDVNKPLRFGFIVHADSKKTVK